jgi:hypothetical protein
LLQLPARLSRELVDTYRACGFVYAPRAARVLTKPGTPAGNEGQARHDARARARHRCG